MTLLPEGFGFESPDALRALLGIPLLLLLVLLRRRAVPLVVPWLPLWEKALGDATRRASPMRWIVSLLVKALLLAAAILAWAHPRTDKGARLVQPTLAVVDASAGLSSATESGTLAAATEAAARSVAARAEGDGPVRRAAWSPDGTAPSGGLFAADVPREAAWVRRAAALEPGARVVLVTPFATAGTLPDGVHVAGVGNGRLPPVGGIREVTPSPGGVGVRVEGTGRSLRLVDGARVVAERAVPESGEVVMPLDGAPLERPRLELQPPDAWPDDDVAWLDAAVPTRLKVLVVARGPTPALDAALAASGYVASEGSGAGGAGRTAEAISVRGMSSSSSEGACPPICRRATTWRSPRICRRGRVDRTPRGRSRPGRCRPGSPGSRDSTPANGRPPSRVRGRPRPGPRFGWPEVAAACSVACRTAGGAFPWSPSLP
jgi:hypothetical protein